ncbi:uncharacterized protein [Littorina saxatilis]|uniref:uncharacterized protein n=1 Tax=Littorina saxatilis TaxID=31220 RepID=UPI0038B4AD8F
MADSADEEILLREETGECSKSKFEAVTIPIDDWNFMKDQNARILKRLDKQDKKRKRLSSASDSDSESSDCATLARGQKTAKTKRTDQRSFSKDETSSLVEDDLEMLISSQSHTTKQVDTTVLDDIEQEFEPDTDVGPPILEKLAKVLGTMGKGKMDDERMNTKFDKHKRPQNCETLIVPRVNPEIWSVLDHSTKSADLKLQRTQKCLLKATYALANTADKCVKSEMQHMKDLVRDISDAVSLNLKTVHEMSMERRSKILNSPTVNKKYRKLTSDDIPITEHLFGDDLKSVLTAIDSTAKLGANFALSTKGRKFFPKFDSPKNGGWVDRRRGTQGQRQWTPRAGRGRGQRYRTRWPQRTTTQAFQA